MVVFAISLAHAAEPLGDGRPIPPLFRGAIATDGAAAARVAGAISKGADPNQIVRMVGYCDDRLTPLTLARQQANDKVVAALIEGGASLEACQVGARVVAPSGVELKAGASAAAEVVGTVAHGATVVVTRAQGVWVRARRGELEGWVEARFLSPVASKGPETEHGRVYAAPRPDALVRDPTADDAAALASCSWIWARVDAGWLLAPHSDYPYRKCTGMPEDAAQLINTTEVETQAPDRRAEGAE